MRKNTEYKYIHHILHERQVAICADIWTVNGMLPQLQMVADRRSFHPKLTSVRLAELFCQALRWQYFYTLSKTEEYSVLSLYIWSVYGVCRKGHNHSIARHKMREMVRHASADFNPPNPCTEPMVPSLGVSWLGSTACSDLGLQISGKYHQNLLQMRITAIKNRSSPKLKRRY